VDALICLVDDPVTADVIKAGDRLKIVASYSVGVNQIDRVAAAARGIYVTHTPNVLTDATADLTIGLMLALSRRIVEGDRMVRTGKFAGWAPDLLLGRDLKNKVLGIVGPGRIGKAVTRRAKAFGMTVIATGRSARIEGDPDDPPRVSFEELLRRSDVVSLHVPLTYETWRLFKTETFDKMKPGSFLINPSRIPDFSAPVSGDLGTYRNTRLPGVSCRNWNWRRRSKMRSWKLTAAIEMYRPVPVTITSCSRPVTRSSVRNGRPHSGHCSGPLTATSIVR
jgi:hypothetical protein